MNTPDATPQMLAAPWMAPFAQFTDPSAWQSFMKMPAGADGAAAFAPAVKMLGDLGAGMSQAKLEAQTAHMKETFERESAAVGAVAHVEVIEEYRAYTLAETDPVIRIATTAAKAAGFPPTLRTSGGGADANIFNGYGVPTTVIACGMQAIHTHDEFCTVSALVDDTKWVLEIVRSAREYRE